MTATRIGRVSEPYDLTLRSSGAGCRITASLGAGGQGEVFAVEVEGASEPLALKWYYPASATSEQREALIDLIEAGSPHPRFLWPLDLIEDRRGRSFGYVMRMRPSDYVGVVDLISGRVPWSARTLATVGLELADSFWLLHSKGLCYRDINFGNVFLRPSDGSILVCDNDNVGVDGATPGQVLGTPYFMGPEVVRGDALPSSKTDRYSLAVLLFYLLMRHHPLIGARELEFESLDHEALDVLLAQRPLFIFDPDDSSNRPDPEVHGPPLVLWPMYPDFIRRRFTEAFTLGLQDADRRVGETMWKRDLARLRDAVMACPACGAENFTEPEGRTPVPRTCWNCRGAVVPRFVLSLPSHVVPGGISVVMDEGVFLYPHHLQQRAYDFASPLAEVVLHATATDVLGLRNRGALSWTATRRSGSAYDVAAGRTVRLEPGLRIQFGAIEGTIGP